MKKLLTLLVLFSGFRAFSQPALDSALQRAGAEHKLVLLRFSGSDWCIPCIRMEKETFGDPGFHTFLEQHFLSLQADFPRQKKHQLSKDVKAGNDALAERYNPQGSFPLTVLLDESGKVVRRWEGAVEKQVFMAELERSLPKQ